MRSHRMGKQLFDLNFSWVLESPNITLALYLIAKFAESAAFLIIYPFGAELYPTDVRGIGIGFSSYLGGVGLVLIPFINYLVKS